MGGQGNHCQVDGLQNGPDESSSCREVASVPSLIWLCGA